MAKGSHGTFGDAPRVCCVCDGRITLEGNGARQHGGAIFRFNHVTGEARAYHADCGPRAVVRVER